MPGEVSAGEAFHRLTRMPATTGRTTRRYGPVAEPGRAPVVDLPPPGAVPCRDLAQALRERKSVRRYADGGVPLDALSKILWAAGGETGRKENAVAFRTVPSAGGLYPLVTYVCPRAVEGLAAGVYLYVPATHTLEALRTGDFSKDLEYACLGQGMVSAAQAVLAWTARPAKATARYRDRGYRYLYMEAGAASQNVYLAATAMGLGCCAVGAFYDDSVDNLLGLEGRSAGGSAGREVTLLLQTVGPPAE